ncbi:MAG: sensor histidine kinase [Corynebacterium sp.]|nr:sensor histidine kinase [Corynebacterium sp.]
MNLSLKQLRHNGENGIRMAAHALTIVLIIAVIGSEVRTPVGHFAMAGGVTMVFAFLYFFGEGMRRAWPRYAQYVWVVALTMLWVAMLPQSLVSIYLVFTLYFLYLDVLPDIAAITGIIGVTILSILSQYPNITPGGVLGPLTAAFVTVGIVFAFRALWRVSNQRQKLIEELLETRNQLAETERAAGIAAERQRIAHEIHDTLAQGLSSIQMLLHVTEQEIKNLGVEEEKLEAPLRKLEIARHTAADNLSEARAMIAALQPPALSKTSLEDALVRVAQSFSACGTEFTINVEGECHGEQLPMKTEATLLRIAQGAMSNVAKHAQAKHCHVTITQEPNEVRLDVVDDGVGFDPAALSERPRGLGHIGLDAMRERAKEQGGTVEVESEVGAGAAISIALPVISKS